MITFKLISSVALVTLLPCNSWAKLNIVTTTTDLGALVREVGGDQVNVDSIAIGTQDPHFIEAKPSYMSKISKADLVVSMGLDLEVGWLPSIVKGARNPKVSAGGNGSLELGPLLNPIEVATGKVTRADGDVHPFGNPHFNLDPIRMGEAAIKVGDKLSQLDDKHTEEFHRRAAAMQKRLQDKTKIWQARIEKSGVKSIVTYHKTLTYFFERFHLENPAILEPKPGIPPTSGHILEVIQLIKTQNIPLILVENYFDPTVTKRIKESVPKIRTLTVPVAVGGDTGINNSDDLFEKLVSSIEGK